MRDLSPEELEARAARRDLAEARRDAYIAQIVAAAPPLTGEQRARLAVLFTPRADEDVAVEVPPLPTSPVECPARTVSTSDVVDAV